MLRKRSAITITMVGNGYIVEPSMVNKHDTAEGAATLVFNDMGHASPARDYQAPDETLLGFIAKHFEPYPNPNNEEGEDDSAR